jgi:hypothetical protein
MNTNNVEILKSLAKFIKRIFNAVCSSWIEIIFVSMLYTFFQEYTFSAYFCDPYM